MADWPKHPDGRNMAMGEMTREQYGEQLKAAAERFRAQGRHPDVHAFSVLDADQPTIV